MMDKETIAQYTILSEFLGKTLGDDFEIVLHDIRDRKQSIVHIVNGHITGRTNDAPLTDLALGFISDQTFRENDYVINYKGFPKNSRILRSSTLFIKDKEGNLTGMLCINFDGSKYVNLSKQILQLSNMGFSTEEVVPPHAAETQDSTETFSGSIAEVTDSVLSSTLENADVPAERLTQEEKMRVVKILSDKGIFMLKGAVSGVAEKLHVSEATLYRYIRLVSKEGK